MSDLFAQAAKSILESDQDLAMETAKRFLEGGGNPLEIISRGFVPGISEVGEKFGRGTLFLPELIMSAETMMSVTDFLSQAMIEKGGAAVERGGANILVATVKGDVHDIGKGIAVAMFKANGYNVIDLGRDINVEDIIEAAVKHDAKVIGTSALLTTTMNEQKKLEETLKKNNLRKRFITLVAGAPVTQRWASRIGADIYAENAHAGVTSVAEKLAG